MRAGVGVAVRAGALGERPAWDVATMVPGPSPLGALTAALGPIVGMDASELRAALEGDPSLAARRVQRRVNRGLFLIVDQLEEVLTLAEADERDLFAQVVAGFLMLAPGVRTVLTLRSDFLPRLGELGALGQGLLRATYIVSALSRAGLRDAIVAPALSRGFRFETADMVDGLVGEVAGDPGALPLLSFALARLWAERDPARGVLPAEALHRIGGAAGALTHHGELIFATFSPPERREARRVLVTLMTASRMRARATEEELVHDGGAPARAALEALVKARLVVAGETYAIAHEALAHAWPRLHAWLDEASEARAAGARLAAAAREWRRLDSGAEGVGGEGLLRDVAIPGALDGASDEVRAFVEASRKAARRRRLRRWGVRLGLPSLLVLLGTGVWVGMAARHRAAVERAVVAARGLKEKAEARAREAEDVRARALEQFERGDLQPAEALWSQALALEEDTDRQRRGVGAALDAALALDARDPGARALYADVTLARLLAAERLHEHALLRALRAHLDVYDDRSRAEWLSAPAHVRAWTEPAEATLTLARYREDAEGRLVEAERAPFTPGLSHELEPGSYLIVGEAPGRYATRYPFVVHRGEERALRIVLPPSTDVPAGMIYVPAGRTSYGSSDDEATRRDLLSHEPAHEIEVGAFLIARTEVTNGDYAAFLVALPEHEQRARVLGRLEVLRDGRVAWKFGEKTFEPGQTYCNGAGQCVDWALLPVDGASHQDGAQYAQWLARSGRMPGARLCTNREWERAARGADERTYPNGNRLERNDACLQAHQYCPAGSHPASRSPFGVEDMSGSEWEWTSDNGDAAEPAHAIIRGGGVSDEGIYLSISNRAFADGALRYATNGIRLCADPR